MKSFILIKHFTLKTLFPLVRCFFILYCLLKLGELITSFLPIQLPASIIGMMILFFLLALQIIPMSWMQLGCQLIIKYMALFFIPATMGIMETYLALINDWLPIIIGTLLSTLTLFIVIGILSEKFFIDKPDPEAEVIEKAQLAVKQDHNIKD